MNMKVLFIGNSYTYYNELWNIVKDIYKTQGVDIEVDHHTIGGATLNQLFFEDVESKKIIEDKVNNNTYDYMIRYGLSDFNITPTEADETDISLSIIPESLRCDAIHPNEKGCEIMANLIYLRGKEVGYWT